jgi:hypothetical protein
LVARPSRIFFLFFFMSIGEQTLPNSSLRLGTFGEAPDYTTPAKLFANSIP